MGVTWTADPTAWQEAPKQPSSIVRAKDESFVLAGGGGGRCHVASLLTLINEAKASYSEKQQVRGRAVLLKEDDAPGLMASLAYAYNAHGIGRVSSPEGKFWIEKRSGVFRTIQLLDHSQLTATATRTAYQCTTTIYESEMRESNRDASERTF